MSREAAGSMFSIWLVRNRHGLHSVCLWARVWKQKAPVQAKRAELGGLEVLWLSQETPGLVLCGLPEQHIKSQTSDYRKPFRLIEECKRWQLLLCFVYLRVLIFFFSF